MKPISGIRMSLQKMIPALPGSKLCSVIIEWMWVPAAPQRKGARPKMAARRIFEAPLCCNDTDQSQAQVREAEFDLERAVRPPDEARCRLVEDDVGERIVDVGDADREKEEPLEQRLGDYRPREGLRGTGKCEA